MSEKLEQQSNVPVNIGQSNQTLYIRDGFSTLSPPNNDIKFIVKHGEPPILELKENGDIYVKGRLIENDQEVVDAFRTCVYQGDTSWKVKKAIKTFVKENE